MKQQLVMVVQLGTGGSQSGHLLKGILGELLLMEDNRVQLWPWNVA